MNVLIADDCTFVRTRLEALTSELEGITLVGQTGQTHETIEAIRQLKPDVVILDLRMPGGGGFRVLEGIKAVEASPIIIMLTAFPYPQYRQKAFELGANHFFDKTAELDQVMDLLQKLQRAKEVSS